MQWIRIGISGQVFFAKLFDSEGPGAIALAGAMPRTFTLLHEQWSGALVGTVEGIDVSSCQSANAAPFQQPGCVYLARDDGTLAICYGQGRLQGSDGLRPAIPLAQVQGELAEFVRLCRDIQFRGATELTVDAVDESLVTVEEEALTGTRIVIRLGDSTSIAVLLDASRPGVTGELLAQLPVRGTATNTHSSGPLVRFWNEDGGDEGETPITITADDGKPQAVLYYGYIYYLPTAGVRGIRIPGHTATMMRSAARGGGAELMPLARFISGLEDFTAVALKLRETGAVPMSIEKAT